MLFKFIQKFIRGRNYLSDKKRARSIAFFFLIAISIVISIIIVTGFLTGDSTSAVVASVCAGFMPVCFILIKRYKAKPAMFFLSLSFLTGVTFIATYGQGIHDISIITLPCIMILGGLFTDRKYFFVLTFLIMVSLAWIVFGDYFELYIPREHGPGDAGDFIITASLVLFASSLVFFLNNNQNLAFSRARKEILQRKKISSKLKKSLMEKEILLKEIHHRVKNNLSIIIGLLNIQSTDNEHSTKEIIEDSVNRIYSIALVHEMLYGNEGLSSIIMKNYINDITSHITSTMDNIRNVEIVNKVKDIRLTIDSAVPCGIILNEIITNSLKHAFSNNESGLITITMDENENTEIVLNVCDNGTGFPEQENLQEKNKTLGIYLVHQLSEQMNGRIEQYNDNGACFRLTFRDKEHK